MDTRRGPRSWWVAAAIAVAALAACGGAKGDDGREEGFKELLANIVETASSRYGELGERAGSVNPNAPLADDFKAQMRAVAVSDRRAADQIEALTPRQAGRSCSSSSWERRFGREPLRSSGPQAPRRSPCDSLRRRARSPRLASRSTTWSRSCGKPDSWPMNSHTTNRDSPWTSTAAAGAGSMSPSSAPARRTAALPRTRP